MREKPILIDRAAELAELRNALRRGRLVAVVGPSGIGKSTLARHVATAYAEDYPGGIHTVEGYAIGRGPTHFVPQLLSDLRRSAKGQVLVVVDGIDELAAQSAAEIIAYAKQAEDDFRFLLTSRRAIPEADATLTLGGLPDEAMWRLFEQYGVAQTTAPGLIAPLEGHPLAATLLGSAIQQGLFKADEVLSHLRQFHVSGIFTPDGRPLDKQAEPKSALRIEIAQVNDELLKRLEKDINLARHLPPRKFEELVAELLSRQGYVVELTPATKDGGKDIYVAKRDDIGAFLYLVECKRYALENPVGVEVVRALYGTVQAERATAGVLVTTSTFTKGALDFQRRVRYQLSLRDYAELHRWISQVLWGKGSRGIPRTGHGFL